jgi:hypothetical protein
MLPSRRLACLVIAATSLLAVGQSSKARACSFCPVWLQTPYEPGLPANRLYLRAYTRDAAAEVIRSDGGKVAASYRMVGPDLVFGPDAPIAAGERLSFRYKPCQSANTVETDVLAAAPAELPTAMGVLRVQEPKIETNAAGVRRSLATIVLDATPEAAANLGATEFTIEVDGERVPRAPNIPLKQRPPFTLAAVCNVETPAGPRDECRSAALGWFTPGKHRVRLHAHVTGATTDPPPATIDVDLTCTPMASADGEDGGGGGGGCSVGGESRGAGALATMAAAVTAVLAAALARRATPISRRGRRSRTLQK